MRKAINLTDAQIVRQIDKLKNLIFEDYSENQDGTYEGELNDSVLELISNLTQDPKELDEGDFLKMIRKGIKQLIAYLDGKVDSINEDVVHFFAFDFITQTLNFMYGKKYEAKKDDYDFMFN
jgi:hypothetical protein